ncbi:MAG: hypothetical protein RLZZ468_1804 [Cyanobacteriota bacterium]|jgi:uncharacterized membrane protein YeiH
MEGLSEAAGLVGTVAFAATAVLAVAPRGIDLLTACVMGVLTAIGGGTVRDLILDQPVFWASDAGLLWASLLASLITFYAYRLIARRRVVATLLYLDAVGIALFAIQGSAKAWTLQFGLPLGPVLLGVITAIGGGLLRDVLAGRESLLMRRELYAIPVTAGCIGYAVLRAAAPGQPTAAALLCIGLIFGFRAAAIHWRLQVPDWFRLEVDRPAP